MRIEYELVNIEKIDTPDGLQGDDWYRYIISKHNSSIEGFRSGSLNEVRRYAEQYIKDLNLRLLSGVSAYSLRKKQEANIRKIR